VSPVKQRFLPSLLLAGALHGAGFGWLATRPPPRLPERRPPTTVRLVTREKPPAPPPAPPPPVEPVKPKEPPRIASVKQTVAEPLRPAPPVPSPATPPPPGPPPQPRRFAVSMNAVVPGGAGGVAVPVTEGATAARGNPAAPASAPVGDNTAFATRAAPVDTIDVDTPPRLQRNLPPEELRRRYPEAARAARLEADVRLELVVDEAGQVTSARVLAAVGNGFDQAAIEAVRQFRFSPATRNGRPLAVRIPWTFKFRLDE